MEFSLRLVRAKVVSPRPLGHRTPRCGARPGAVGVRASVRVGGRLFGWGVDFLPFPRAANFRLVVDDLPARAEGADGVNQPGVQGVAMQRTAGLGQDVGERGRRGLDRHIGQRRDGETGCQRRRTVAAAKVSGNQFAPVQVAGLVHGGNIILLKNVVGAFEFTDGVLVGVGPGDEIISDGIQKMIRARVAAHEAADAPVVNHVVDILDAALRLGIAALVVDPEIVRVGDVRHGIGERTEPLRVHAFAYDAVLKREVVAALRDAQAIPAAPLNGAVIENHVAAAGKIHGTFAAIAADAFAETQVTHDDVLLAAERNGAAVKQDAITGRRLAEDGKVAGDGHVGLQPDDAADIKDDDAIWLADRVAEGAGTGIGQRRDVENFAAAPAAGELAEPFRAGKGERCVGLRQARKYGGEEKGRKTGGGLHR